MLNNIIQSSIRVRIKFLYIEYTSITNSITMSTVRVKTTHLNYYNFKTNIIIRIVHVKKQMINI